jgi:hypothetical protein
MERLLVRKIPGVGRADKDFYPDETGRAVNDAGENGGAEKTAATPQR